MCYFSAGAVLEVILAWLVLNTYGWRCLLLLSCLPAIVLMLLVWMYLPESATWLLARGERKRAAMILQHAFALNHESLRHDRGCQLHPERWSHTSLVLDDIGDERGLHEGPLVPCLCGVHGNEVNSTSIQGSVNVVPIIVVSSSHRDGAISTSRTSDARSQSFLAPLYLVFSPTLRTMSLQLSLLFFLMAFVYYGLVLMSLNMVQDEQQHQLQQCTLRGDQYFQLFAANLAEFPGLFLSFLLLDRIGRRLTITYMFLATAACMGLMPLLWSLHTCTPPAFSQPLPRRSSSPVLPPPCPLGPLADWVQSILLFGARAFSLAFNQALWIYTTELYPAQVRSSGLGLTTVFARVGGALSPFVCQWLYWREKNLAVYACVGAACLAAWVTSRMPVDTHNLDLAVHITKQHHPPASISQSARGAARMQTQGVAGMPDKPRSIDAARVPIAKAIEDDDTDSQEDLANLPSAHRLEQKELDEEAKSILATLNLDALKASHAVADAEEDAGLDVPEVEEETPRTKATRVQEASIL